MSETKDLVFIKEVEGRDKPVYTNVGILHIKDNGKMSVKLNSIPVGEWDGWLAVFDKRDKGYGSAPQEVSDIEPF